MRHFLSALAVPALTRRVRVPTVERRLVPATGRSHTRAARPVSAGPPAVVMPTVAVAAEEEHLPAVWPGTGDKPQRVHSTPRSPVCGGSLGAEVPACSPRARHRTPGAPSREASQWLLGGFSSFRGRALVAS